MLEWSYNCYFIEWNKNIMKYANLHFTGWNKIHIQFEVHLDLILVYIRLWIDCVFEFINLEYVFFLCSLQGIYRVTDKNLLFETA